MSGYEINETEEYTKWFETQSLKVKSIISKRLKNIIEEGHFGDLKNVSEYDKGINIPKHIEKSGI